MEPPTAHTHAPDHDYVRASDHDRDTTVQRLGDALSEGALDTAEHRRRLDRALTATTRGDLHRLTADLPESRAARDRAETARRTAEADADKRAWLDEWGYWAGGAAIMTVIWAASAVHEGEWTFFWPAVPLGIWAAILVSYAIWPSRDDH
ncbi:DUF1707 SHOCT-like domain-containing protein [Actinomadura chibensis]|uniref:DUF1707 domain-containing protein n=1 Tax=Actinomadura chibensis TaxID=392828 RepID=A0A5D0NA67_9ACTN|nr:DUF1707 domain-containing protein [Actinomadura chibensis]TYB41330.1 DUF1707 domain-containing protein [Actinomadura chibensis]